MSVEDRLQRIEDRAALESLKFEYCRYADSSAADRMVALFTEDCVVNFFPDRRQELHGREAFVEYLGKAMFDVSSSSHHISNMDVLFENPDRARTHCYLYSWQRYRDPAVQDRHRWVRYEDVFVRTGDGWRQSELMYIVAGEITSDEPRLGEVLTRPLWPDG